MIVPKLRAPIVLVHGLLGFDQVKVGGWTLARYFPDIPELFQGAGNRVLVPQLSPTSGVADRAAQLKVFLDKESPNEPVHLLAHSMGGLDARYMISCLGGANRVLTLTTIATPHRGSAFADWGIHQLEWLLSPAFALFNVPRQAFYDLTTTRCREFNQEVTDAPGVRYFSIAGQHLGGWLSPEWQLPHQIVLQTEGPNDGVVSLSSATYGESVEVWEGDHLSLTNWISPLALVRGFRPDRKTAYTLLLRRLADEGF